LGAPDFLAGLRVDGNHVVIERSKEYLVAENGKPAGFLLASWLAVKLRVAEKPFAYSWRQLAGAGALAGIGFTMSLFIASQAFPVPADFAAAKIAVFAASVLSAIIGVAILWKPRDSGNEPGPSG